MADTSPGLPPVGELVQITVQDADGVASGRPDGTRFDSLDWPPGIPVGLVTSWCRVLVLPDSDETAEALYSAMAGIDGYGAPSIDHLTLMHDAAMAALREAAIR